MPSPEKGPLGSRGGVYDANIYPASDPALGGIELETATSNAVKLFRMYYPNQQPIAFGFFRQDPRPGHTSSGIPNGTKAEMRRAQALAEYQEALVANRGRVDKKVQKLARAAGLKVRLSAVNEETATPTRGGKIDRNAINVTPDPKRAGQIIKVYFKEHNQTVEVRYDKKGIGTPAVKDGDHTMGGTALPKGKIDGIDYGE